MEAFGSVGKSPWGQTYGLGQGQTLTGRWWAGAVGCDLGSWVTAVASEQVYRGHSPGVPGGPGARVSPV